MRRHLVEQPRYQGHVAKLYTHLAPLYDLFTDHEPAHHRTAVQLSNIRPGDVVLEVACGTGRGTLEIAARLQGAGKLYAMDLTDAMLARARRRLQRHALLDNVELRVGDAHQLPFPDHTFDHVYNAYMLDLIDASRIPVVLSEFRRVLKPGGRLTLVNMSKQNNRMTLYEWLYERGLLSIASGACRPANFEPFVVEAGFEQVTRVYRPNRSWWWVNWLTGTEIVTGHAPC